MLLRLIGKWLNAGVLEDGSVTHPGSRHPAGRRDLTPPGERLPARGAGHVVRADGQTPPEGAGVPDPLRGRRGPGLRDESDARRVLDVLPKRFGKYGLTLHPDKTRLVPFEPPRRRRKRRAPTTDCPGTFDLLGFTHYWGRSRKGKLGGEVQDGQGPVPPCIEGRFGVVPANRHHRSRPAADAEAKLVGHYAYYGITGNSMALRRFRDAATWIWSEWLSHRRRRGGRMTWDRHHRLLKRHPLPPAMAIHSVCRPVANP